MHCAVKLLQLCKGVILHFGILNFTFLSLIVRSMVVDYECLTYTVIQYHPMSTKCHPMLSKCYPNGIFCHPFSSIPMKCNPNFIQFLVQCHPMSFNVIKFYPMSFNVF